MDAKHFWFFVASMRTRFIQLVARRSKAPQYTRRAMAYRLAILLCICAVANAINFGNSQVDHPLAAVARSCSALVVIAALAGIFSILVDIAVIEACRQLVRRRDDG